MTLHLKDPQRSYSASGGTYILTRVLVHPETEVLTRTSKWSAWSAAPATPTPDDSVKDSVIGYRCHDRYRWDSTCLSNLFTALVFHCSAFICPCLSLWRRAQRRHMWQFWHESGEWRISTADNRDRTMGNCRRSLCLTVRPSRLQICMYSGIWGNLFSLPHGYRAMYVASVLQRSTTTLNVIQIRFIWRLLWHIV